MGGSNELNNLMVVHTECHKQITKLSVETEKVAGQLKLITISKPNALKGARSV
jgi:hypothetical protein